MKIARLAAPALVAGLALIATACGGGDASDGWDSESLARRAAEAPYQPEVITSAPAIGQNRIGVALFGPDRGLVADATIRVRVYRLPQDTGDDRQLELVEEVVLTERVLDLHPEHTAAALDAVRVVSALPVPAPPRQAAHDGHLTAVYVGNITIDESGWWGLEFDVTVGSETHEGLRRRVLVQERTTSPMLGEPVPPSRQLTLRDVDDPIEVSSAIEPTPEMLELTVEEALATGKPSVIAFVTPAFCETRFCGPVLEMVIVPAFQQYGDRVNFLHIEPYDLPKIRTEGVREPVPTVIEWGLQTEPVIFVTDAAGLVVAKLEGITDLEELSQAIEAALQR